MVGRAVLAQSAVERVREYEALDLGGFRSSFVAESKPDRSATTRHPSGDDSSIARSKNHRETSRRRGQSAPDFPRIPFAKVERRAYNAALFQACETLSPDVPLSSALFELGRDLYPHFASTMLGKAIFSVAGRDYPAMARLAPRAYSICNGHGTFEVVRAQHGLVHVSFHDVWDPLPFTSGIWHGGLDVCGIDPEAFDVDALGLAHDYLRIGD